jgi:cold shock CspA family protein
MGRSKETYGKKEVRNKQVKKRKDKENRRLEKKETGSKGSFENMIAWVDENGMISSTPPDPANKKEVKAENIEVGVPKAEFRENRNDKIRKGKVTNFDSAKGYGFIFDEISRESVFVHISDCAEQIKSNDLVEFEVERGAKGIKAFRVKLASTGTTPPVNQ